jgi:6-phospho-beta-galactosidase
MLSKNIIPNVTLHHFDSPMWLVRKGDFLKRENVKYFKSYAEYCFKEYKEVYLWSTLNEIHAYSNDKFIKSSVIPFGKNDFTNYFIHVYHMLLAHAEAIRSFKQLKCKGKIGIANANASYYPIKSTDIAIKATSLANTVQNTFIFDAELLGKFSLPVLNDLKTILGDKFKLLKITSTDLKILKDAAKKMD